MNSIKSTNRPLFPVPLKAGKWVLFIFCFAMALQLVFAVKAATVPVDMMLILPEPYYK